MEPYLESLYLQIDDFNAAIKPNSELRKAFRRHLVLVSKACRAICKVDNGDCEQRHEEQFILDCLKMTKKDCEIQELLSQAEEITNRFKEYISQHEKLQVVGKLEIDVTDKKQFYTMPETPEEK